MNLQVFWNSISYTHAPLSCANAKSMHAVSVLMSVLKFVSSPYINDNLLHLVSVTKFAWSPKRQHPKSH